MAEDPDGMNEAVEDRMRGGLVIGLTIATRAAEQMAQIVAARAREAAAADASLARELSSRLAAERGAAKASVMGVNSEAWWKRAKPEEIATAWQTTQTWRDQDPHLAAVGNRIRDEVHERYGIDVKNLRPDPHALEEALEVRGLTQDQARAQHQRAGQDVAEAVVLITDADGAERANDASRAGASEAHGEVVYDSAQRRENLATRLEGVAEPEAVQSRVLSDTGQARPAADAVATAPDAASRRPAPGRGQRGRVPERTLSR